MSTTTLLHLSDLHFGMEAKSDKEQSLSAQRKNTLDTLEETLRGLPREWRPDLVVISGDIAWKGRTGDYEAAAQWLTSNILEPWALKSSDLIICPGNHDLDRNTTIL